jgi:fibronectin type 3 domain-containing protein
VTVNNVAPTADASAGAPYIGDQGADIVLDGSASSDPSGSITLYEWDLDNDTAFDDATGVNATFNSAAPGNFTVGLRVTDGNGGTGTTTVGVTVNDIAPSAPVSVSASGDDGQVSLDWADNPEPDLATAPYRVYRSETQGVLGTELAASPFSSSDHIDSTAVNGTTYYYVITAEDTNGNVSVNSAEVATTPNGPVHAYWTLDENAGFTTADTVLPDDGSGTIFGAEWTTGISGSALDFNGIGDNVVIDNTPQLQITGKAISMHAWVFPRDGAVAPSQKIIAKFSDRGISDAFGMMIQDYRLRFRLDDELMISSHIVTLNEWVHIAMVYDGTDMRIYVNGVLDTTIPELKSDPIDASSKAVHLGRREGEGNFFDGIMDEVQILNSVLIPGVVTPPARGAGLFFEDITLAAGVVSPILGGHGIMFADVNNDSRPDFYITNNRENNSDRPDFFHENIDGAVFVQAQTERGIIDTDGGSHGAVWADLDNDGDYDLVNGTTWDNADPNPGNPDSDNVYRNDVNTSGIFTEVTPASIQAVEIETNGITAFDMDGDGGRTW